LPANGELADLPNPMPKNCRWLPSRPVSEKQLGFYARLPGMVCQIALLASGSISFPYVSEGIWTLLGIAPDVLQNDPSYFLEYIHPEDIPSLLNIMKRSALTQCFWNWEGRLKLPDNTIKWARLVAAPQNTSDGLLLWEGLVFDITENKLGELEIRRAQQQLQELASHIQDAKEQERLRIAREIHDEIGSLLTAIKMDLSWLNQRLPKQDRLLMDKAIAIEALVNKAVTSASDLAQSLRPGILDCFGIIAAIEIEAQEFSKRSGVSCTIVKSHEIIELPEAHSISLFRILQETLNNIMKHARAKNARIEITQGPDHLELAISDDGVGFDDNARNKPRSFGLRGIKERVAHLGGSVKIASSPKMGVQIVIIVPLGAESAAPETAQQALLGNATI
jgi:two-component system sensor histidine kinase UhpB